MAYATVEDVERGFRTLTTEEASKCAALLDEAAVLLDAVAPNAKASAKDIVSRSMVRRALTASEGIPLGATQGTMSAGGYSQSWTVGSGAAGELYLSKSDRRLLGLGNRIGMASPYGGEADD